MQNGEKLALLQLRVEELEKNELEFHSARNALMEEKRFLTELADRPPGMVYPINLKEEDTLIEAKIVAMSNVIEAMASHRPYRPALGIDEALAEILKNRGISYDAGVVDGCLQIFKEKIFRFNAVN
jgi:hypothetical protein